MKSTSQIKEHKKWKRQNFRSLLLMISLLLFPVTLYYFSPALIINAAIHSVVNGSFIVFCLMFLLSIPFGRVFCAYCCPAGGLQECLFRVNDAPPKQGWRNVIKYFIWTVWLSAVIYCYWSNGGTTRVDFFFETEGGISVSSMQSYIIYYGILCLIVIPCLAGGRRTFCHYFCWMAPFMAAGTKLRRLLRLPGLHIKARDGAACTSCGQCRRSCPMGIDVPSAAVEGRVKSMECIQCGACVDGCPRKVLAYGMTERSSRHGNGKKT